MFFTLTFTCVNNSCSYCSAEDRKVDIFKAEKTGNLRKFTEVIFFEAEIGASPVRCNPGGERTEQQSSGLLPKAELCERVNRNEQCDRSKGAVRRLRLRNAARKKAENPHEKQWKTGLPQW